MKYVRQFSRACVIGLLAMPCFAAPTQEEVDAAKRTQALAEAEQATAAANKAKAEAESAEARAKLGTLDLSKLSKPSGEAKSLDVEANLLAYASVERISGAIAKSIASVSKGKVIVIYSEKELKLVNQYQTFIVAASSVSTALSGLAIPALSAEEKECTAPESGGGIGVLGALDVASQTWSLFKFDKKLEGTDVTVDSFALAASVMAKLQDAGVSKVLYLPTYLGGNLGQDNAMTKSASWKVVSDLQTGSLKADALLVNIGKKRDTVKALQDTNKKPTPACKAAYADSLRVLDDLEVRTKSLKGMAEKYVAAATTPDEKTADTLLQGMLLAESLKTYVSQNGGAYVLQLKPVAAGGTVLTKSNFFSTSFHFSGGAVVSYILTDGQTGAVMSSGTVSNYGGYVEPHELGKALRVTQ